MAGTAGGFVRGEASTAAAIAGVVYAGLSVIGEGFPPVLALIAGIGELVPIVGPFLAAVPAVGVALLHAPTQAAIVFVFFIVAQQIESNVLGAVIAIPFAGLLRVVARRVAAPAIRDWTGAPDPDADDPDQVSGRAAGDGGAAGGNEETHVLR